MGKAKLLSVVVPAFRQEKTIITDVRRMIKVLDSLRHDWEIIVVVDGDEKTFNQAKKLCSAKVKVLFYPQNQGKGYAVRYGMQHATGDWVAFLDAGMEIDPNGIAMLLEHMEWYDADIIVGSKRHPASQVNYPLGRKILSWGYFLLVWVLFGVKVKDTQAGIKIFRREVLEAILPVLLVKRYAFDIEMLSVAHAFGYQRIYEAPIKLDYQFGSLTNAATLRTIFKMLWDTAAVFYRLKILRYYAKQKSG